MSNPPPGKHSKKSHLLEPFKGMFSSSRLSSRQWVTLHNATASRSTSPTNSVTSALQINPPGPTLIKGSISNPSQRKRYTVSPRQRSVLQVSSEAAAIWFSYINGTHNYEGEYCFGSWEWAIRCSRVSMVVWIMRRLAIPYSSQAWQDPEPYFQWAVAQGPQNQQIHVLQKSMCTFLCLR